MIAIDAETLRLANFLHMHQIVCCVCREPSLFIRDDLASNIPITCGRLACGVKAKQAWAKEHK